jgi:hypothetical protein
MTEAEAIRFLQKRKRHMRPSENLPLGEVILLIRRSNISMIAIGLMLFSLATIRLSNHRSGYGLFFGVTEIILGFVTIGLYAWSQIRLHQACKALNYATDGSSLLSGTK